MTSETSDFIGGIIGKTLELGGVATVCTGLFHSWWLALSVAVGSGMGAANIAVVRRATRRLAEAARQEDDTNPSGWRALLGFKTLIFIVITAFAVLVVGLNPLGFVGGYSLFIVALIWQTIEWNRKD